MKYTHKVFKGISLPGNIYRVMKRITVQKKFLEKNIDPILHDAFEKNDGSLDRDDLKKITHYYGLAVPAVLGEAFCALRGSKMTDAERWASTCQGAMTGLFDDFFDKDHLPADAIEKMIYPENNSPIKNSRQQLFGIFYNNALQYAPVKKTMQETLMEVYKAQVESKKQKDHSITKETLLNITFYKGGSSLIFYRTAFSPAATAAETKLLFDLGGLMQLANDIFDVYKDREGGIQTLVTQTKSIKDTRDFFKEHLDQYFKNASETGFKKKHVEEFLNIISIGIFSRCFVCLQLLETNERSTGNEFSVHHYSRKQLICDMDKKINMLRSAWSHINDIP